MAENATKKQRGFQKGKSGNPAGKPKGVRNRATLMAEKLMQDDAEDVIRAVTEKAKQGDMTAGPSHRRTDCASSKGPSQNPPPSGREDQRRSGGGDGLPCSSDGHGRGDP